MKNSSKIEKIITWILICGSILTFGLGLILGYKLTYNQYAGILAILIASILLFTGSKRTLGVLFIILALGTFNLLGFGFFLDAAMTFGISKANVAINSPGIQLYSLILMIILIRKRKHNLLELYNKTFGLTEVDQKEAKQATIKSFMNKFENLSDSEVLERLEHKLIPEAQEALLEIKKQRGL